MFALSIVLLSFIVTSLALAQMEYQNAEGERGRCIQISTCPAVYSLFNSQPLSLLTTEFFKRSKCKFDERTQLLCCVEPDTQSSHTLTDGESSGASFELKSHPKASLLPLDSCGLDQKRMWQASYVKLDEFPWLAMLQYHYSGNYTSFDCGGVLISKRYVLTTAVCAHPRASRPIVLTMVRLGENDLDSDPDCEIDVFSGRQQCAPSPQNFGIEEVIPHPEHDPKPKKKFHDIALLRLDRDAKLDTKYVQPICLPTTGDVKIGKELLLAGWGRTDTGMSSHTKVKVELPVVSPEECRGTYAKFGGDIRESQMCAGGVAGKDFCTGDSGMPLMDWTESLYDGSKRYKVAGIASYGSSACGVEAWPGVFSKVFHYVPWILDHIRP